MVLAQNAMCPLSVEEVQKWRKSNFKEYPNSREFLNWLKTDEKLNKNPYYFRDQASKKKIDKYDLGRAFYHIAQRRGFLSNRLDVSDNNIIEDNAALIEHIIEDAANKIDLNGSTPATLKSAFPKHEVVPISALNGVNMDLLYETMVRKFGKKRK